jgi:ribosomal-protein-alanine N-acetyltransferase
MVETRRWSIGGLAEAPEAALLALDAFDPHFREAWTEAQMAGLLGTSTAWLNLCRSKEGLVAFALCRQALDEVELLLCATHPKQRRQGLGRELVEQVIGSSRARGARRLFLEVRRSNDRALGLYRATGFVESGCRPGYYRTVTGDSIDAITLSLGL